MKLPPLSRPHPRHPHHRATRALCAALLAATILAPLLATASPAATPQRGLSLQVPGDASPLPLTATPDTPRPAPKYAPAPRPNRDLEAPSGPRGTYDPKVGPSLITRGDTYRGEGFSKGSSAQGEQERRVKPGAGLNLTVPFAPN